MAQRIAQGHMLFHVLQEPKPGEAIANNRSY